MKFEVNITAKFPGGERSDMGSIAIEADSKDQAKSLGLDKLWDERLATVGGRPLIKVKMLKK